MNCHFFVICIGWPQRSLKCDAGADLKCDLVLQGPPKAINMTGTRFTPASAPGIATPSSTDGSPSISISASDAPGEDYSILATPSFTPGVEDSPFITWGDLQGTPLRLDPEDDIQVDPAAATGPHFLISKVCGLLTVSYHRLLIRPGMMKDLVHTHHACSAFHLTLVNFRVHIATAA